MLSKVFIWIIWMWPCMCRGFSYAHNCPLVFCKQEMKCIDFRWTVNDVGFPGCVSPVSKGLLKGKNSGDILYYPLLIKKCEPEEPLTIDGANSQRWIMDQVEVVIEYFLHLCKRIESSWCLFISAIFLDDLPLHPQGISHNGVHRHSTNGIECKPYKFMRRAGKWLLVFSRRVGIFCEWL